MSSPTSCAPVEVPAEYDPPPRARPPGVARTPRLGSPGYLSCHRP
jgi:hypothetical protein